MDALNHLQVGDRTYNGYRLADIAEEHGTNRLGVDTLPQIVTRGLLVDVAARARRRTARARRRRHLADARTRSRRPASTFAPGDAVLFHTGWGSLWGVDNERYGGGEPGPGMDLARWLAEHAGRVDRLRHLELRPGAGGGPGRAVRRPADPQHPPRRRRRGEPAPRRDRRGRRAPSSCSSSRTPSCAAPPVRGSPRWPSSDRIHLSLVRLDPPHLLAAI